MRGRLGGLAIVVAVLAASCRAPVPPARPPATTAPDQTDVWFMQHMVPHLWQASSITFLTRDRITHPQLAQLADTMTQRDQANIDQLQTWLARQGLSPHGHSHQQADNRKQTDLERLSRLRGTPFDLALLNVMTARDRAAITMATTEVRQGTRPEVRQLAQRMLAVQQGELRQMNTWKRAWSRPHGSHPAVPAQH